MGRICIVFRIDEMCLVSVLEEYIGFKDLSFFHSGFFFLYASENLKKMGKCHT